MKSQRVTTFPGRDAEIADLARRWAHWDKPDRGGVMDWAWPDVDGEREYADADEGPSEAEIAEVLGLVRPELRDILADLDAAAHVEIIPVLQTLGLDRAASVGAPVAETLADVPVEVHSVGRLAAWGRLTGLSLLAGGDVADQLAVEFMAAAGYPGMSRKQVREECAQTRRVLALVGADSWPGDSGKGAGNVRPLIPRITVAQQLEVYRFLLQR
ncbi:MAG TPA: hypothetical protein H9867_02980 [Candidatus Corynebacterium gallistercoris]|uniref:Uncharacterized protein n=1 Tax=Candidatus Corynebacterium gallistercoris TaxID=2838530 RepID=A0A9D1UPM4_9CORY|nr:hypothetical protein [Candidatus Corynebacterium gallistercoris]